MIRKKIALVLGLVFTAQLAFAVLPDSSPETIGKAVFNIKSSGKPERFELSLKIDYFVWELEKLYWQSIENPWPVVESGYWDVEPFTEVFDYQEYLRENLLRNRGPPPLC